MLYGPLVLAGDLSSDGLTKDAIVGPEGPQMKQHPMEVPSFRAAGEDPASWIKPGEKPLTFRTTNQAQDVTLEPFNRIFDKRYSVYWQVT